MIAVTSTGRTFRGIAQYLATGRSGEDRERVAWSAGRNLPVNEPELAAKFMRATAAQNGRVEKPVYHLVLSFDPGDRVDRAAMERVTDRVLTRLGLAEHQAVIVAHRDREHPHMHVLVNRVHPETGRAAPLSFDYRSIQEVLRAEERTLRVREVPGTLYRFPDQERDRARDHGRARAREGRPEHAPQPRPMDATERGTRGLSRGERRERERTRTPSFLEQVRARLPEIRAARSWAELESALARSGWRLERSGQGLVVTDGTRYVSASRVAAECSMRRLEARFNVRYQDRNVAAEWVRPAARTELSPTARYVVVKLRQYERATRLEYALGAARGLLDRAEGRARAFAAAGAELRAAEQAFARSLSAVYRDPDRAHVALREYTRRHGAEPAATELRQHPELFGALAAVERGGRFGMGRVADEGPARAAAELAGRRATVLDQLRGQARMGATARSAEASVAHHGRRLGALREARRELPDRSLLATQIARAMSRLSEQERERLGQAVSPRQRAIGEALRGAWVREGERDRTRYRPPARDRHTSAMRGGAAVHRALERLAPREFRQLALAIRNPQAALTQSVRRALRDAALGREGQER